jgi:hypothetical protein
MRWLCHGNVSVVILLFVQLVMPLYFYWAMAELFPAARADGTGQCRVYLSLMSMGVMLHMFMNIFLLKSRSNKRHLILFTTFLNGSN